MRICRVGRYDDKAAFGGCVDTDQTLWTLRLAARTYDNLRHFRSVWCTCLKGGAGVRHQVTANCDNSLPKGWLTACWGRDQNAARAPGTTQAVASRRQRPPAAMHPLCPHFTRYAASRPTPCIPVACNLSRARGPAIAPGAGRVTTMLTIGPDLGQAINPGTSDKIRQPCPLKTEDRRPHRH